MMAIKKLREGLHGKVRPNLEMRSLRGPLLLLCVAGPGMFKPCQAAFISGDVLRQYCEADDRVLQKRASGNDIHDAMACLSYVAGVHDSMRGMLFCTPDQFDNGQATEMTKKYIRAHPEKLNQPAARINIDALSTTYPCAGKNS